MLAHLRKCMLKFENTNLKKKNNEEKKDRTE